MRRETFEELEVLKKKKKKRKMEEAHQEKGGHRGDLQGAAWSSGK